MGGIEFKMDMSQLQSAVTRTLAAMSETGELMEEIGEHMRSEIQMAMDKEQTLDGEAWPEGNRNGQALRKTSKLYNSITYEATSDSVAVGVAKAAEDRHPDVHQDGMVIKAKNAKALRFQLPDGSWRMVKQVTIPKREIVPDFGKSDKAKSEIRHICEEYLRGVIGI
ncbi:MAG: phage virion morphogenesis protein [Deferribacterales bacterium]